MIGANSPVRRQAIEAAIPSIGRVEVIGYPEVPYGGTAFVVGDDLLMTNRHVAALFAAGLGERGIAFLSGRDSAIDFLRERGNRASQIFDVAQVVMVHPWWDMAMLKVPDLGAMHPPLALDPKAADGLIGREVAVIGYPAFDRRNPVPSKRGRASIKFEVISVQLIADDEFGPAASRDEGGEFPSHALA